ncbi:MAG: hypothetical protein M3Y81_08850 [Chloroflexota bacterium]|nr:hypothetical protein [Chloroflexota bacterium]
MTDTTISNVPPPRTRRSISEMIESRSGRRNRLIHLWNTLTAMPEASTTASFAQREAARQSRLTSNVLFFFTVMVVTLLPACFFAPGHAYFWLDLGLAAASILALALNRKGYTLAAGLLVSLTGFLILTVALFTTVPFDETTLQGYDMYVIVELLAVSLLPIRSIFLVAFMSTIAIIGTLVYVPHTAVLDKDLHEHLPVIIAQPVGTLFLVAGIAYILASTMATAMKRAGRAELIAHLQQEIAEQEHLLAEQKRALDTGIQQILQTHVAVANGQLQARAPLSQDNMLWQIASALNTLLVRFQRAVQAETDLWHIEQAVTYYVNSIQQAEQNHQHPLLPLSHTQIDPLIVALQGKTFNTIPLPQVPSTGKLLPRQRRIVPRE